MDSNSAHDEIDKINNGDLSSDLTQKKTFLNYFSDLFFDTVDDVDSNNNDDGNICNDIQQNSYNNLLKLSALNTNQIYEHFDKNILCNKSNAYNKKYSNILKNQINYEIDYELKIDKNETIQFIKSKI